MARNIELARLFYTLEAETTGLEGELKKSERSLGRLADFVTAHPVAALGGLAAAATGAAVKATQMAASFEQSMTEVGTLVDKTSVDMKRLSGDVLDLFRSLPIDRIDDLTKGLYNVVSAGIPAGDAITFLRTAAEASIGGVTDVNTAVDGLTTAVNAFREQGVTAEEAADAFFVTVKSGKTTFADLSGSIGQVAGLANSLGVSLDELLASTAALTLGGLQTSTAMAALKQVLANVAKPTADLQKAYPALAAEFDITALKSKGLSQFLLDLAQRIGGNTDAATKMFGSVEALNAVLTLTANDGAKVRDITAQMAAKAGAASAAYTEMAGTAENNAKVIRNHLSATMIELGNQILPIVTAELKGLVGLFALFDGSVKRIKTDAAVATVESLSGSLGKLTTEASKTDAFDRLGEAMRKIADGPGGRLRDDFASISRADFSPLTNQQLGALKKGLLEAARSGEATAYQMREISLGLIDVEREITSRVIPAVQAHTTAVGETTGAVTTNTTAVGDSATATERAAARKVAAEKLALRVAQDALALTEVGTAHLLSKHMPALGKVVDTEDRLRDAIGRVKQASDEYFDGAETSQMEEQERTQRRIDDLRTVTTGVLGLATVTGALSDEAALAATNFLNIATNIGKAIGGDPASIIGVIGSLGGLLGGIFSGESAASRKAKELARQHLEAVEANTARIGDLLGLNVSGKAFTDVSEIFTDLERRFGGQLQTPAGVASLNAELIQGLRAKGLTVADLEQVAKSVGVELHRDQVTGLFTNQALSTLFDLLKTTEPGRFERTFAGQRAFVSTAVSTGAAARETEFGLLTNLAADQGITAITDRLAGLDVTTGAGRAEALAQLRALILDLNRGTVDAATFGGASGSELLALLADLIGILADPEAVIGVAGRPVQFGAGQTGGAAPTASPQDQPSPPTSTEGPAVELSIASLDTGIADLATLGDATNTWLAQIAANTAAFGLIAPPAIPLGPTGPALGGGVSVGAITVNVSVGPGDATPEAIGVVVSEAVLDAIDRALRERAGLYARLQGSAVVAL